MRNFLFIFFTVLDSHLLAQKPVFRILDEKTKEPVVNANICFETIDRKSKSYTTSDTAGYFVNPVQKRSVVAVSSIGYVTFIDTINPAESHIFYLHPTTYAVDEVVVTGQFKPVKADKSIYKVEVIGNRQIADKGANNVAELLSSELNLRLLQDGILGTNIDIQGLSSEHVKVLVDGVPVIGRQNGILDLTQIPLSDVDHVEIVEGPLSVVYGSNALAGTINIITKEPFSGKFSGKLNSYNESVGIYNFDASLANKNKNSSFQIGGGRNFFSGYSSADTSRVSEWKPKVQYFGNFDYSLKLKNSKLRVNTGYFNEELLNKGLPELEYLSELNQFHYKALDEYHYTTRWDTKADYFLKWNSDRNFELLAAYSYYNKTKLTKVKDLVDLTELRAAPSSQDTTKFNNVNSRAVFTDNSSSFLNVQGGLDLNIETGTGKRLSGQKQIDDYAAFLVANFLPKEKLNSQVGLRFIDNSKFSAPVVYSLNLKYVPFSFMVLRGSYGKGFRSPSLKELYLDFVDINHNIHGNENLKSEYSTNLNASAASVFNFGKNSLSLDASVFYNNFKNKIQLVRTDEQTNEYSYINITNGNYLTKGGELRVQYQFHPRLSLTAGMNLLGHSLISNLDSIYYSRDYTAALNYKSLRYLFRLSVYYKYTDSRYDPWAQYDKNNNISKIMPFYIRGYHTLDLTLSRPFFKNSLEIAVGLKNLFNNKDVFSIGTSSDNAHASTGEGTTPVGWGRTYFVRLSYNFVKF